MRVILDPRQYWSGVRFGSVDFTTFLQVFGSYPELAMSITYLFRVFQIHIWCSLR